MVTSHTELERLRHENIRLQQENVRLREENTRLRSTQRRYHAFFEQAPISIQFHAPDGCYLESNPAHDRLWNVTPRDMVRFNPLSDPEVERIGASPVRRAFLGETVILPGEYYDPRHLNPQGRVNWVDAVCFPLKDEVGRITEVVIVHQELSHLREAEARMQQREVQLLRERELAAQHVASELRKSNEALRRGIERLASEHDMGAFLSHILQEAVALRDGSTAQIFLYDPEDNTLAPSVGVERSGRSVPTPGLMVDLPINGKFQADITGAWSKLLASGIPLLFDIERDRVDFWPGTVQWHRSLGHQVVICRALVLDGRPLGMLGMAVKQRCDFSPAELESFEMLAQQAALAIEITRLAEEAHQVAILEERNRIAREIHDTLAQALTGIALQQTAIEGLLEGQSGEPWDALSFHVGRTRELARHGLIEARRSVSALRPQALETDDLCTAVGKMVAQRCTALAHRFTVQGRPFRLPLEIEQHLLRITQEALTNVLRHARAQHLQVNLSFCPRRVRLCVRDDGRGFVPGLEVHGFGLQGMRERAERIGAQLFVGSRPGHGTRIFVTVPVGRQG